MKRGFHLPALGGLLTNLGGLALTVATSPAILHSVAGKIGVSAATLASVIQSVTKPLQKEAKAPR